MARGKIFDWLFPANIKCIICGCELDADTNFCVCEKCYETLPFINYAGKKNKICLKCGTPIFTQADYCLNCKNKLQDFDINRSVFRYVPPISSMLQDYKYNGKKYLYYSFGGVMADYFKTLKWDIDFIIPIPLHEKRIKERGFNQSELIANRMGEILNKPVHNDIVIRQKNTCQQTQLSKTEREENVKDAFCVIDKKIVKDKNILLIDDVFTTGSTLSECAEQLKKYHPKKVFTMTLAHANHDKSV